LLFKTAVHIVLLSSQNLQSRYGYKKTHLPPRGEVRYKSLDVIAVALMVPCVLSPSHARKPGLKPPSY
jgi:hypothetical protein